MHHLFRLRHLVTLAGVIGAGMLPLQACHLNLGETANYALLAGRISASGAGNTITVNRTGTGTSQGAVGALTYAGNVSNFNLPIPRTTFPNGTTAPYTAVNTALTSLTNEATSSGINLTSSGNPVTNLNAVTSPLGTGILGPGIYYFTNNVTLPANSTLTLFGEGEYVFVLAPQSPSTGALTFGPNSTVALTGGANAANISWVASSVTIGTGANVAGQILTRGDAAVAGATLRGRLQSSGTGSNIEFTGANTINQTGLPPHTTVASALVDGSPVTGSGTAASPYFISQGQTLTYTVSGIDPDGTPVTLTSTGDEGLAGYAESTPLPVTALTPVTQVTYAPAAGSPLPTQPIAITYTSTDNENAVCTETVYIRVNAAPTSGALTDVTGEAPFFAGRTGTVDAPLVACVGQPLSFGVSFTDPDFNGADQVGTNNTSLQVAGNTGGFTFAPTLPITTNPTGTVGTTATFTPAPGDAGATRTVTFTATDELGATTTQTVAIYTASAPTFTSPTTVAYNVCLGQPLEYTVTATDATTSIPGSAAVPTLELSVVGTPEGATHTPNAPDQQTLEETGDVLVFAGDPAGTSSTFSWTPQAGDEGTYLLTYTATNIAGCSFDYQIAINVAAAPTLNFTGLAGSAGGTGTEVDPYLVRVDQTTPLSFTVTGTSTLVDDTVTLGLTNPPAGVTLSPTGTNPAVGTFTVAPTTGQLNTTFPVTFTATSVLAPNCASTQVVYFRRVNAAPTSGGLTNVTGEAPFFQGRAGTEAEPLVACVGEPLNFGVGFTDPDFVGDDQSGTNEVTLSVAGNTSGITFLPQLPGVSATGTVNTTATFIPTGNDANTTRTLTFTGTDEFGATSTQTVSVYIASAPTFTSPATVTYDVCVGQPLQYTVTATDATTSIPGSAAVPTLELSVVGTPEGATHTPNAPDQQTLEETGDVLVFAGDPAGTSSTFSWTPQAGDEGTYLLTYTATNIAGCSFDYQIAINVAAAPALTVTGVTNTAGGTGTQQNPYLVRAGQTLPFGFTVTGTSTLVDDTVTLAATGTPGGATFTPTGTNPAVGAFSFLPTAEQLNTTFPITFTATSVLAPNCASTQTVYVRVVAADAPGLPASITLVRSGGAVFGEEICYTATVFDNTPADQGGPRPLPGVQVCFDVQGTTGNNGQFLVVTDANGQAQYCFTPVFPGTVTVTAVIDQNGDCLADDGTTPGTDNTTVPAPVPGGTATYINGQGKVAVLPPIFGGGAVAAEFSLDISPKPNGTYKGKINVLIPGAGVNKKGRRTNLKLISTRILSVSSTEVLGGRTAVIFGVAKITGAGESGLNGNVTFRADVVDGGTPGIGKDSFTLTLLNSTTGQAVGPIGGILGFGRPANNGRSSKDDIKIRTGIVGRPRASF